MAEFDDVKPGDTLYRWAASFLGRKRLVKLKVERVTRTQIIIGGDRYWKKDGRPIGAGGRGNWLQKETPQLRGEFLGQEFDHVLTVLGTKLASSDGWRKLGLLDKKPVVEALECMFRKLEKEQCPPRKS